MDIKISETRSRNMSAIRSKNTKPEVYMRKQLFARGYRYGLNSKSVPGHPDIYMKKYNTVIFVNGCFWHRHEGCKYAYMPKTNIEFWKRKFDTNIKRDKNVRKELERLRIKQIVIWECTIKNMKKYKEFKEKILKEIESFLNDDRYFLEM
ncbi:MAG: DNA mismatch endonuclease Vsr [Ruminococcus sp.]|nr:DNA mismatch endonuclease Vsr [Ruminococcus sp.]